MEGNPNRAEHGLVFQYIYIQSKKTTQNKKNQKQPGFKTMHKTGFWDWSLRVHVQAKIFQMHILDVC